MALDQQAADAFAAQLVIAPEQPGDGAVGFDPEVAATEAARATVRYQPMAQALVDLLATTEPAPEVAFDLRAALTPTQGAVAWAIVCTDRRVVWGLLHPSGPQVHAFAYGTLRVERKRLKLLPELVHSVPPRLEVPRLMLDDEELARMIEADVPPTLPAAIYSTLLDAVAAGKRPAPYRLVTPSSNASPATVPSEVPAAWHPDPSGRSQHRWWDGTGWTDQVAVAGVVSTEPL